VGEREGGEDRRVGGGSREGGVGREEKGTGNVCIHPSVGIRGAEPAYNGLI
jgi:hypothetical protein